jgi:hypothetical protein
LGYWPWDLPVANNVWGQIGMGVGSPGLADNRLTNPVSVAVPDGLSLVVADSANHRALIYECGESLRQSTRTCTHTTTRTVTQTPTQTPSFTVSPTYTPTPTQTLTLTLTLTLTTTLTPNPLDTKTITPTATPTYTLTRTTTPSHTPTATLSFTVTPTFTNTPTTVPSQTPYPLLNDRTLAYPNPMPRAHGRHCIAFPPAKNTDIWIHNLLGEQVHRFAAGDVNAAQGWACWTLRTENGNLLAPGIYYYRAQVDGKNYLGKFTVR